MRFARRGLPEGRHLGGRVRTSAGATEFLTHDDSRARGNGNVFVQAVVQDPNQSGGYSISNAVAVRVLMANQEVIRGPRYKLITNLFGGEELHALKEDPLERSNLLISALNDMERHRYHALLAELERLRTSR